jgi:hypothetical protein
MPGAGTVPTKLDRSVDACCDLVGSIGARATLPEWHPDTVPMMAVISTLEINFKVLLNMGSPC